MSGKETEAHAWYEKGLLPPGQIHARSRRWMIKIFAAHVQEALFFAYYGTLPPRPYVFDHLHHVDEIVAPNLGEIAGWREARVKAHLSVAEHTYKDFAYAIKAVRDSAAKSLTAAVRNSAARSLTAAARIPQGNTDDEFPDGYLLPGDGE